MAGRARAINEGSAQTRFKGMITVMYWPRNIRAGVSVCRSTSDLSAYPFRLDLLFYVSWLRVVICVPLLFLSDLF